GHPQATFLIRATLDPKAEGNWTQLFPIITQSGRGAMCEPTVTAPKEWVGQKGFIGIACDAPDGMLFQVGLRCFSVFPPPPSLMVALHTLLTVMCAGLSALPSTLSLAPTQPPRRAPTRAPSTSTSTAIPP